MSRNRYAPGWDDERVRRVLEHYGSQSDDEAVAEDETPWESNTSTTMRVPVDLVQAAPAGQRQRHTDLKSMAKACSVAMLLLSGVPTVAQSSPADFETRLVDAAMERLSQQIVYDGSYRRIDYPNGDVPGHVGVCTDLIVRAYRAVGIDLQQLVHEDMVEDFAAYPTNWGLARPDHNIDHRRVPNLEVFFRRNGETLIQSRDEKDYQPGDLVTWLLPSNLPHIGIVVARRSPDNQRPLVVHNIGNGPELSDCLFEFPISGHYRYDGSR